MKIKAITWTIIGMIVGGTVCLSINWLFMLLNKFYLQFGTEGCAVLFFIMLGGWMGFSTWYKDSKEGAKHDSNKVF